MFYIGDGHVLGCVLCYFFTAGFYTQRCIAMTSRPSVRVAVCDVEVLWLYSFR